jgi:hypothetical protein
MLLDNYDFIGSKRYNPSIILARNNLLHSFHTPDVASTLLRSEQSTVGGVFGAEVDFVNPANIQGISGQAIKGGFGIVYNDGGAVNYQALILAVTHEGSAAVSGTASLTAGAAARRAGSATLRGAASLSAGANSRQAGSAAVRGTASLGASANVQRASSASLNASATVTGAGNLLATSTARLSGTSNFVVTPSRLLGGRATISGSVSLTASAIIPITGSATLSGTALVRATADVVSHTAGPAPPARTLYVGPQTRLMKVGLSRRVFVIAAETRRASAG